ncbi:hypothetical protein [Roseibium sp. Sym1]|uniref:hypothetical protein n=1 Tax=Roseibium sp. Sym1 TaxID=3016006 RepID=UPI0022B54E3B|nr:hypothetical protein [Roseibium sp. Sym1]
MQTTYPNDEKLIRHMSSATRDLFALYIADLEKEMEGMPMKPYDTPLHESTGLQCWYDFFEDGFSPREAIDEDLSNAYSNTY